MRLQDNQYLPAFQSTVNLNLSLKLCQHVLYELQHMFSSVIEGDSCLVNVNFIAKLFNRIHNYGRTKTLETVMEGLNLICEIKEAVRQHQSLFHRKTVGNKGKRLLMKGNSQ